MIKMSIKNPMGYLRVQYRRGKRLFFDGGYCFDRKSAGWSVSLFFLLFIPIMLPFELAAGERFQVEVITRADQLPPPVRRMHQALLRAARSGQIDNMREVLQMNELMPLIDGHFIHDPVKRWKEGSIDKTGREILALLTQLLELPPIKKTTKNGASYVWPYFAGVPLDKLTAPEIVRLYGLSDAAKIASILKNNSYVLGVITLGADGTWHSFDHPRGHWMIPLSP